MINKVVQDDIFAILDEKLPWSSLYGKTVLVTGANGFIASYIVEVLLALKKVKVLAFVRNIEKAKTKFEHHQNNENLSFIVGDISDTIKVSDEIDYIVHAASQASPKYYGVDPVGTFKANTIGTYNCLELARIKQVKKLIFISSCEVYGIIDSTLSDIDETYTGAFDPTDVRSCYGESKRMGENMCVCYSQQYSIPVSIIRPAHTYGPGLSLDDGRSFCDFVSNVLNGEDIILNSDGTAKRKFLYISDFIRAFFTVLFKGADKEAYNVTYDTEISIKDLANLMKTLRPDKNLKVIYKSDEIKKGYLKSKSSRASFVSNKVKKLGWKPVIDEKQGFERMLKSYEYSV